MLSVHKRFNFSLSKPEAAENGQVPPSRRVVRTPLRGEGGKLQTYGSAADGSAKDVKHCFDLFFFLVRQVEQGHPFRSVSANQHDGCVWLMAGVGV